jgi:hypothetical protein
LTQPKQCADGLDITLDGRRSRVVIHHKLLDEVRDDPVVSWLVATGVFDTKLFFMKFRYTACLNLVVLSLESDLSQDIFLSTICPREARLAWDLAGRKCRLSAPCAPVRGWRSSRYGEKKVK